MSRGREVFSRYLNKVLRREGGSVGTAGDYRRAPRGDPGEPDLQQVRARLLSQEGRGLGGEDDQEDPLRFEGV